MFCLTIVVLLFLTTATGSVRTVIVFDNGCGSSQTMYRTLLCQDRMLEEGCVHLNSMYRRQNNAIVAIDDDGHVIEIAEEVDVMCR